MPLSEYDTKEALRAAADGFAASELPGSAAAREGIADTIPLVMMGLRSLREIASAMRNAYQAKSLRVRY